MLRMLRSPAARAFAESGAIGGGVLVVADVDVRFEGDACGVDEAMGCLATLVDALGAGVAPVCAATVEDVCAEVQPASRSSAVAVPAAALRTTKQPTSAAASPMAAAGAAVREGDSCLLPCDA